MPGSVLSSLQPWSPLSLTLNYPCFMDKEMEAQRFFFFPLSNLPKVIQIAEICT